MPSNADYFKTDPEWEKFATANGLSLLPEAPPVPQLDVQQMRKDQLLEQAEWTAAHPLQSVGYESRLEKVTARDGYEIEIKISRSTRVDASKPLPLLFVSHGGGWIRGTHVTEEVMLLGAFYEKFDVVVISVNYRRIPDDPHPVYLNDCWDCLQYVSSHPHQFGSDPTKIVLAGSSVGGQITAVLSHWARDASLPIKGVIMNVPVLCDPRHFPIGDYEFSSYDQCFGALLNSGIMKHLWTILMPDPEGGSDPVVSPLLGDLSGLPRHLMYIAGQDPVRDEGIAYAAKLKKSGTEVVMHVYQGVPHIFNEWWEIEMTKKFWQDVRADFASLIDS